ncbi:MAG: hypothetical protein E6K81_12765 [Candidatus Eisenbacteria bacterium]|uniref:FlgD/Vpr Ig-like domain-containing protein n=1 Tax=Eiseniibacteriota bacterium TaxID=2212470 RepID=A0A538U3G1_UNCEI|nr:MAG: hypothetical protein E6K81_12765 [Candidatus Eisenbacteria bacterium]
MAFVYYGNGGDGLDRIPRQYRPNNPTPVSLLGGSKANGFSLAALGRTPAGRGKVRMEWDARPLGTAFNPSTDLLGPVLDTGAPVPGTGSATTLTAVASNLPFNTPYHWRVRTVSDSPFFPRSPWFSLPYNAASETDLRTGGSALAVLPPVVPTGGLRVEMIRPNPSGSEAEILYALPRAGRARLTIEDLQGRQVAVLADGVQTAGPHAVAWDGREENGSRARPGMYWVRLRSGDEAVARKLVHE